MHGQLYILLLHTTQGAQRLVFPIYLSILYQFTNVTTCPVVFTLVVLKIYTVIEVESNNKQIQSDMALEKWWVTQCGRIQLCTTVSMGMTINNCWKLFCYGFKRYHYEKLISIKELL